jgi:hypothetical protein
VSEITIINEALQALGTIRSKLLMTEVENACLQFERWLESRRLLQNEPNKLEAISAYDARDYPPHPKAVEFVREFNEKVSLPTTGYRIVVHYTPGYRSDVPDSGDFHITARWNNGVLERSASYILSEMMLTSAARDIGLPLSIVSSLIRQLFEPKLVADLSAD